MQRNVYIKICGITNSIDRELVIAAGADYFGSILDVPASLRSIDIPSAAVLFSTRDIKRVAVVVDPDPARIRKIIDVLRPDAIQLHGSETPEFVQSIIKETGATLWKVIHIPVPTGEPQRVLDELERSVKEFFDAGIRTFLLDTVLKQQGQEQRGGTGKRFDWTLLERMSRLTDVRYMIAGGVAPGNVRALLGISTVGGIDANSGVELFPGKKDAVRIRNLMAEIRNPETL